MTGHINKCFTWSRVYTWNPHIHLQVHEPSHLPEQVLLRTRETSAQLDSKGVCHILRFVVHSGLALLPADQVDPAFRALSGRLEFTVRRHKFNKDSLPQDALLNRLREHIPTMEPRYAVGVVGMLRESKMLPPSLERELQLRAGGGSDSHGGGGRVDFPPAIAPPRAGGAHSVGGVARLNGGIEPRHPQPTGGAPVRMHVLNSKLRHCTRLEALYSLGEDHLGQFDTVHVSVAFLSLERLAAGDPR